MTWWVWLLIWTVLVLGAGLVLFLLGRDLWRKLRALTSELGVATDRLGEISERLAAVEASTGPSPADVGSQGRTPRPQR